MVEIDPQDPTATPVKRSALGRAAHEGAAIALTADGRAVVYMGEDARFEYIYKFVSRDRAKPGGFAANRELLDHGTLYVARFDVDGKGEWLPLVQGQGPLTADKGFANQGDVVIKARQASDLLGATKMDRPEWITVDPITQGGLLHADQQQQPRRRRPALHGRRQPARQQHLSARSSAGRKAATSTPRLRLEHLVLAGDPKHGRWEAQGNIKGDSFGSPDGLWFDRARRAVDPDRRVHLHAGQGRLHQPAQQPDAGVRPHPGRDSPLPGGPRRLRGHGLTASPDLRTLFINIQHPGEPANERSDPERRWRCRSGPTAPAGRARPPW